MSEKKKPAESPHIDSLRKQDRLNKLAAKRLHIVGGKVEKYQATPPMRDIEDIVADASVREIANAAPGEMIAGRGVFIGTWEPCDEEGRSLGATFNVFAAPEDLADGKKQAFSYPDAVKRIALLKNWHGHDGSLYANAAALREALKDGSYEGGWIVPPCEVLSGRDVKGLSVASGNIYACKDKGVLRGTFKLSAKQQDAREFSHWYWSSTEKKNDTSYVFFNNFSGRDYHSVLRTDYRLSCRPVRLEAVRRGSQP